eukprot:TRINITY_DN12823_c0_g1_i4.p1 TRINITY_DN12823_c0_g1~~TRINITY_DN12823_c0_g1_i4.p1  ORF type:complete len:216 (+),score=45.60 TRINITY_DN12823_c0_g1_i4:207-854(+)
MNLRSESVVPSQPEGDFFSPTFALLLSLNRIQILDDNKRATNRERAEQKCAMKNFPLAVVTRKARSLPARVEKKDFRKSSEFIQLELTSAAASEIVFNADGKVALSLNEGNINCTIFLTRVESLLKILRVKSVDRTYRKSFTQPYIGLYNDEDLCYIPEVLDAAQERQPFIVLNGEKYYFSFEVMRAGDTLYDAFVELKTALKVDYELYSSPLTS